MVDKKMSVLVVEDNTTMRRIMHNLLTQLGFSNVAEAVDGTDALQKLREKKTDFIISDWHMEPMTGLELLKQVRADAQLKAIPFLMVTAESKPENIIAAKQAGVSNYIIKPFSADTLKAKMGSIFGAFNGSHHQSIVMDTQAKLGNALFSGLTKLREQKGTFDMADVGALFEQLSATLHPNEGGSLRCEIEQLAVFLKQAKSEISAIGASDNGKATGDATLHLDAVVKGTEEASHAIMDAADAIQTAAKDIGVAQQKIITEAITKIYEACNFQDLTGQRVNKVIKILAEIDKRINNMIKVFGAASGQMEQPGVKNVVNDDAKLLNGPQLPDQAPSQDDIDALFSKS